MAMTVPANPPANTPNNTPGRIPVPIASPRSPVKIQRTPIMRTTVTGSPIAIDLPTAFPNEASGLASSSVLVSSAIGTDRSERVAPGGHTGAMGFDPPPVLVPHPAVPNAHDRRLRERSSDAGLLLALREVRTDRAGALAIVGHTCDVLGVPVPRVGTHARRRPETGHTRPPARLTAGRGLDPRRYPPDGHIQLSTTPTLGVIAHELGHHLVFHLDPPTTPAHGYRWVDRYDEAGRVVAALCDL
jgi:hypothetical protein